GDSIMAPSDDGQLDLFAKRDIVSLTGGAFAMSDAARSSIPTMLAPAEFANFTPQLALNAASGRHADDAVPAIVTAGRDIANVLFLLAKHATLAAGRDIRDVTLMTQNVRAGDTTRLSA